MLVEVGKSMSRFLTVGLTGGGVNVVVSPYSESYMGYRCCNASAVRTEVIRGLDTALLERRGQSWCWQLGHVESSEHGD